MLLKDRAPVGAKDLFINPVGRLVKGERTVLAKQQILEITGRVAIAVTAQNVADRRGPQDLRSRGNAPEITEIPLYQRQFVVQNGGHLIEEITFHRLLEAGTHGPTRQLMDLNGGQKPLKLRFKILVVLPLIAQDIGSLDNGALVDTRCLSGTILQGVDDR
ncbi:MAG: hypothetical protein P8Z70_14065 [Desulfuromonadales bacterium]